METPSPTIFLQLYTKLNSTRPMHTDNPATFRGNSFSGCKANISTAHTDTRMMMLERVAERPIESTHIILNVMIGVGMNEKFERKFITKVSHPNHFLGCEEDVR